MTSSVSAIIPTVGRPTLRRAIQSVLDQTHEVDEVIVAADTDQPIAVPSDSRITVLRSGEPGSGPARTRQRAIDHASGSVIALLDDDDEWLPTKLEYQLRAVSTASSDHWIVSSRIEVRGPGSHHRVWPRRLIGQRQPVADYLFRFRDLTVGGAVLQSSTLCFPTALGRQVRWDTHADSIHDEPSWLLAVQKAKPDLSLIQLPEVLSRYYVNESSLSRQKRDLTTSYIQWGLDNLRGESPRVLGDYLCTSPVSAAVSAGSVRGVGLALRSAIRHGRPGPYALSYAVLNAGRVLADSTKSRGHR